MTVASYVVNHMPAVTTFVTNEAPGVAEGVISFIPLMDSLHLCRTADKTVDVCSGLLMYAESLKFAPCMNTC